MKRWYKHIGIVVFFRVLYKAYLKMRLETDTHIGFENYWAKKRYDDFEI